MCLSKVAVPKYTGDVGREVESGCIAEEEESLVVSAWFGPPPAAVMELGTGHPLAEAGLAWCVSVQVLFPRHSHSAGLVLMATTRGEIPTTIHPGWSCHLMSRRCQNLKEDVLHNQHANGVMNVCSSSVRGKLPQVLHGTRQTARYIGYTILFFFFALFEHAMCLIFLEQL